MESIRSEDVVETESVDVVVQEQYNDDNEDELELIESVPFVRRSRSGEGLSVWRYLI